MSRASTSLCRHTGRYTAYVAKGTLAQSPAKSSLQVRFAQMCAVQRQQCRGLEVSDAVPEADSLLPTSPDYCVGVREHLGAREL